MASKKKLLQAAAGSAGGAALDIPEVFSTYLYDGTGSAQTITNGIDLSGEGGLVWAKSRTDNGVPTLYDTARGTQKPIFSSSTSAEGNDAAGGATNGLNTFNSNGFTIGADWAGNINVANQDMVSWTFRKAPKFFDVVTYTGDGDGTGRAISHNLGSAPGMILIKKLSSATNWIVYHRSEGGTKYLELDNDSVANTYNMFDNTDPTSTQFYVSGYHKVNQNGETFVAYLFAHNNSDGEFGPDSDQDIIKCGDFQTSGSGAASVNLGFEPQWLIVKAVNDAYNWEMYDVMRGFARRGVAVLKANTNVAEADGAAEGAFTPTNTGFSTASYWGNNVRLIYMAIRRGPLAEPENATDVFQPHIYTGDGSTRKQNLNITPDMVINMNRSTSGDSPALNDRLRGKGKEMYTSGTGGESNYPNLGMQFDYNNAIEVQDYRDSSGSNYLNLCWKRAPGYFDMVAYTGNDTLRTINHNLGVVPEMMWLKRRDSSDLWYVYHSALGAGKRLTLHETDAESSDTSTMNNTAPTASVFTLNTNVNHVNANNSKYIAYLFATVAGVSKVGSYTGNGSTQNIDCGFSNGARFVLIKKTSDTGHWVLFDTARGIVAGNDARLKLNSTDAESSSYDDIDPLSSGFTLNNVPLCNTSGASYIFYAIA